jgi:ATP-binding cassette subfamily C protein
MQETQNEASRVFRSLAGGVLGVAGLSFLCNIGMLAVPIFNMHIFNLVLPTRDTVTLTALATGLAVAMLVYGVIDHLRGAALDILARRLANRLSLPALRAVAAGGNTGANAGEALNDLETLRQFIASPACVAPFDMMWAPVLLGILLFLHWAYAVMAAVCCLIVGTANLLGDALSRRQMLAANEAAAVGLRDVASAAHAAEAVVAMGMLPALSRRWQKAQHHSEEIARRALLRSRFIAAVARTLRLAMTGAMVALGLILALSGLVTGGSMVASNMILARILQPFERIADTRRAWVSAFAAWNRISRLLNASVPVRYRHPLPCPLGRLSVERLVWIPPGAERPVLRGVNFAVEPGESLGIIGPSGAGKSSLLKLIMGVAAPTSGGVYLDGTSTYLWEREDFARHVGYVPQQLALADATVAENISRLQPIDWPAVIEAAKFAGVHDAIMALPYGYSTRVVGFTLSGGQRQRLALARALYTRPRLLVLDEPSAFLDGKAEAAFADLLRHLKADGTTVVFSTHRPSIASAADRLLVMKEGLVDRFGARDTVLRALEAPAVRMVRPKEALAR